MNLNRRISTNALHDNYSENDLLLIQESLYHYRHHVRVPVKVKILGYIMCFILLASNVIFSVFILLYIQEINNKASILSNSSVINSLDKIENIINYVCNNLIKDC